jgi:hypothetical protein
MVIEAEAKATSDDDERTRNIPVPRREPKLSVVVGKEVLE